MSGHIDIHHRLIGQPVIGRASAGCLVGRTRKGHREFMKIVKSDARYRANHGYRFMTGVLAGSELAGT